VTSEETESESFNTAHSRFRHRQREVKLIILFLHFRVAFLLKALERQNEFRPNALLAALCRSGSFQSTIRVSV
jgi:hypothetical protein